MKLRTFLTIAAVVAVLFGLGLILAPGFMDSTFGTTGTPGEMLSDRLYGGTLLAFAVLFWLARDFTGANARPILLSGLVGEGLIFVVTLLAMLGGVMDATGWITVVISLLFALGFAYFQFMARPQ